MLSSYHTIGTVAVVIIGSHLVGWSCGEAGCIGGFGYTTHRSGSETTHPDRTSGDGLGDALASQAHHPTLSVGILHLGSLHVHPWDGAG